MPLRRLYYRHPTQELSRAEKSAYTILWNKIGTRYYMGKYVIAYYQGHIPIAMVTTDEFDTHPDENPDWAWKSPNEKALEKEKKKGKQHGPSPMRAAILMVALKRNRNHIIDTDEDCNVLRSFFPDENFNDVCRNTVSKDSRVLYQITNYRSRSGLTYWEVSSCTGCFRATWGKHFERVLDVNGREKYYCKPCVKRMGFTAKCGHCKRSHMNRHNWRAGEWIEVTTGELMHEDICATCCRNLAYCEDCAMYCAERHRHAEKNPCCIAPHIEFIIPTVNGPVHNDTRFHVDRDKDNTNLSDRQLQLIGEWLTTGEDCPTEHKPGSSFRVRLGNLVSRGYIGHEWLTSYGTFPKRLERNAYSNYSIKVEQKVLEILGVKVKAYLSASTEAFVEFTRLLNGAPSEFGNDASCWWTSAKYARCVLKAQGGFAMRTFDAEDAPAKNVTGRAWVIPILRPEPKEPTEEPRTTCYWCNYILSDRCTLCGYGLTTPGKNCRYCNNRTHIKVDYCCMCGRVTDITTEDVQWRPTHDTEHPDGYIVFNGYKDLANHQVAAKMLAKIVGTEQVFQLPTTGQHMYLNTTYSDLVLTAKDIEQPKDPIRIAMNWDDTHARKQ